MKKILILIIFIFSSKISSAQLNFDIKAKTINDVNRIEKRHNSELFKTDVVFLTSDDIAPPVIYRRKQKNLPDLLVHYYVYKKDSKISEIDYIWDEANFVEDKQPIIKTAGELVPYISKYKELLDEISSRFGKSQSEGSLEDTAAINGNGLTRSDNWKNDRISIKMNIQLRSKPLKMGPFSALPGYFIRVAINNHSDQPEATSVDALTKEKIDSLDSKVKLFFTDLFSRKFDDARKLMSDQCVQSKDDQLNVLSEAIKDDKWDLGDSGKQILLPAAKIYNNLRYTRQGDTNKPPSELVSVLFDEDDKIILVQPLKRRSDQ